MGGGVVKSLPGVVKATAAVLGLLALLGAAMTVARSLNADNVTTSVVSQAPQSINTESTVEEPTAVLDPTRPESADFAQPDTKAPDIQHLESVFGHVDDRGQVDYQALAADPTALDAYSSHLASLDRAAFDSWSDTEQIALLSNAYNTFTLQSIVDSLPLSRSFNLGSMAHPRGIRWISGVWDKKTWTLMGEPVTLDHIEHGILRKDYDEPRLHAALVCAAKSCPPLRHEPFTGAKLEAQLEDQMRRFVTNPAIGLAIDRAAGKVLLSKIFDWYGDDFVSRHLPADDFGDHGDKVRAVLAAATPHLDPEDQAYLREGNFSIGYLDYDWSLNEL